MSLPSSCCPGWPPAPPAGHAPPARAWRGCGRTGCGSPPSSAGSRGPQSLEMGATWELPALPAPIPITPTPIPALPAASHPTRGREGDWTLPSKQIPPGIHWVLSRFLKPSSESEITLLTQQRLLSSCFQICHEFPGGHPFPGLDWDHWKSGWGFGTALEDAEIPSWEHVELPRRGILQALPAAQGSHSTMEGQGKTLTMNIPQVEAGDNLGGDKKEREFRWHWEQGTSGVMEMTSRAGSSRTRTPGTKLPSTQIHGSSS